MDRMEDSTDNARVASPRAFYEAVRSEFAPLPASASWAMADGGFVLVAFTEERSAALLQAIGAVQGSNGRIEDSALQQLARANQRIAQLELTLLTIRGD